MRDLDMAVKFLDCTPDASIKTYPKNYPLDARQYQAAKASILHLENQIINEDEMGQNYLDLLKGRIEECEDIINRLEAKYGA